MTSPTLADLLVEYDRSLDHTASLVGDLDDEQIAWRPHAESSAIGWHLGHQAAVAHYLIRNLTAAEPRLDPEFEALMDSATPETQRGDLPARDRIDAFRTEVAERVRFRLGRIDAGDVGAPAQLRVIASTLLTAVINHEYQHATWIGEVRRDAHGRPLPDVPQSDLLQVIEGYPVLTPG